MHSEKHVMKRLLLSLTALTLVLSGCVTVPNISACAALPRIVNGASCVHNISPVQSILTRREILDLLDTQPIDRLCIPAGQVIDDSGKVSDPGLPACAEDQSSGLVVSLPARGPSVIIPPKDFGALIDVIQEMCRDLGSRCDYEKIRGMSDQMRAAFP